MPIAATPFREFLRRSPLAAVAVLALCLAVGAIFIFVRVALRIRFRLKLLAAPVFKQTELDDLPFSYRPVLAAAMQQLNAIGFTAVANLSTEEPTTKLQITQTLLVNRDQGETASIICRIRGRKFRYFTWVQTEFSDGTNVRTTDDLSAMLLPRLPNELIAVVSAESPASAVYHRHCEWVSKMRPEGGPRIVPEAGGEIEFVRREYLKSRSAPGSGFMLDRTGEFYRPTRWGACRMAVMGNPAIRGFRLWKIGRQIADYANTHPPKGDPKRQLTGELEHFS